MKPTAENRTECGKKRGLDSDEATELLETMPQQARNRLPAACPRCGSMLR